MGLKYIKDVSTLKLNVDKCIGCKLCSTVCPHNVFIIEDKKAKIVDKNKCIECGACMKNCPTGALWVRSGVGWVIAIVKAKLTGGKSNCCE